MPVLTGQDTTQITLRPYQTLCVERTLEAYTRQPKGGRALLVLPTGCGKTVVFVEIARQLGLKTLIIAHRTELLQQAADKFRMLDPQTIIGQVGDGRYEFGAPITVAGVDTISRPEHLQTLQQFEYAFVVIDECHHSAAAGYQAVLNALPDAFVLGVTATPDRLDQRSIERIFGEPIFSASIIDMIEKQHLSNLRALAIPTTTSLAHLHTQHGDYQTEELTRAVDTQERNECIVKSYLKHCQGRQALCFAVTVAHAQHLATTFMEMGVVTAYVSGETPKEERKLILHDFERGLIQVVCNVGVLTEGYDCPQVSCIIMARPTRSRALYTQCIGRGTRLAPGKQDCIILDITDNTLKHRLEPLCLGKMLDLPLRNGEDVFEANTRKKEAQAAAAEKLTGSPTLKGTPRTQDVEVNLLERMPWQRGEAGIYTLTVGSKKHRIILYPSETITGYYSVWAQLAPSFQSQQWLTDVSLEWAQEHAEKKARLIQSNEARVVLVDNNASWRNCQASTKQITLLNQFNIPVTPNMTSGQASDLIQEAIAQREQKQRTTKNAAMQWKWRKNR